MLDPGRPDHLPGRIPDGPSHPHVHPAERVGHGPEAFEVEDRKVVDAHPGQPLDGGDEQRRTPEREGGIQLGVPVAADRHPGVTRKRDQVDAAAVGGEVDQHDGVRALRPIAPQRLAGV
jgi:hypothetical protein